MIILNFRNLSLLHKNLIAQTRYYSDRSANISPVQLRDELKTLIGLEIHAQLSTNTKLFSSAPAIYGSPTNSSVSLFDAAIPGTLPALNKNAVKLAVISALSLGCNINAISYFDRKHYFYSDMPAGYQITQQRVPLAVNGKVDFAVYQPGVHKEPYYKTSKIKQIQLEQDSGKSLHEEKNTKTLIDLNRAGVALIEIVFQPDIENEEEACALVKEVIDILKRVKSCSCKLQEGALRIDANLSLSKNGKDLGIKSEIKNIGSIHGVLNALKYERKRHLDIIQNGGTKQNVTLLWDASLKKTVVMRDKEGKLDYRFMPEPNLPPLRLIIDEESQNLHRNVKIKDSILDIRSLRSEIPILPQAERMFLIEKIGMRNVFAYNLVNQNKLFKYFNEIISENSSRKPHDIYNILMHELLCCLNIKNMDLNECNIPAHYLGQIVDMIQNQKITKATGKKLIIELLSENKFSPKELVEKNNLEMIIDSAELKKYCLKVIEKEKSAVLNYKKNKKKTAFKKLITKVLEEANFRAETNSIIQIMTDILNENDQKI